MKEVKNMNNNLNNVIPIRKTDRFKLCKGHLTDEGDVEEYQSLGFAYLKPQGKTFRLKFWMFPKESFFLSRDENSEFVYTILAIEEYTNQNNELITNWREIGKGYTLGNYIRLDFYLIKEEIYLCLYPEKQPNEEVNSAVGF